MDARPGTRGNADELRCVGCGVLLGKKEGGALGIRRGDLQANIDGEFRVSFVCYRPRCRRLSVFRFPAVPPQPERRPK